MQFKLKFILAIKYAVLFAYHVSRAAQLLKIIFSPFNRVRAVYPPRKCFYLNAGLTMSCFRKAERAANPIVYNQNCGIIFCNHLRSAPSFERYFQAILKNDPPRLWKSRSVEIHDRAPVNWRRSMSLMGLGRVKTPTLAARIG
jgi:hypothetical protein